MKTPAELKLRLQPDELNLVLMALGQLPYVQVQPLMKEIEKQLSTQLVANAQGQIPKAAKQPSNAPS